MLRTLAALPDLQPFVGDRGRPFQLFRQNQGNFYTAVIYSLQQLTHDKGKDAEATPWRLGTLLVGGFLDLSKPAVFDSGQGRTR